MKVSVHGVGYVGLVQAAVLAEVGHDVLCIDIDKSKVINLQKGIVPIHEPGLEVLVERNSKEGRLNFTVDVEDAVNHGELQFIAVGTPPDENGSADLQYVLDVAKNIAQNMNEPKVIVNKSTVPVGTADKVSEKISEVLDSKGINIDYHVVSNPEFLKEGDAVSDCMRPDRIIIGTDSEHVKGVMRELYAPFNRNHEKIFFMDVRSAELTKYAANCMLATKISFMNEMANVAERVGADIEQVRLGIGSDERIGYHFIYPGCGYGGSCFPKDIKSLTKTADSLGYEAKIMKAVESVNTHQKNKLFELINQHFDCDIKGKTFAIWGLAFKPKTDDMREAPSRVLIDALLGAGAIVQAYDPEAMGEAQRIYGDRDGMVLSRTKEAALKNADALVVVTEWQQFKAPDFVFIKSKLNNPVIFDGRNLYDPLPLKRLGLKYYSVGRACII